MKRVFWKSGGSCKAFLNHFRQNQKKEKDSGKVFKALRLTEEAALWFYSKGKPCNMVQKPLPNHFSNIFRKTSQNFFPDTDKSARLKGKPGAFAAAAGLHYLNFGIDPFSDR